MDDIDFNLNPLYVNTGYWVYTHEENKTIQFALALAQKLQSGVVSEGMVEAVSEAWYSNPIIDDDCVRCCMKAMTRALIEETRNELQRGDNEGLGYEKI